ncbi:hypothetical protein M408DRAFT_150438 [Serendipita vermifera MAFF 305830]|uniref:Uncharacterized protein n=1 Tax=Serendipita vermifera MAFF 305830 TaxID=933852 RepID=A0A0C2XWE0_SERVB|nr:hypothetical protein M408DRAFT_150438 [Serendipita vermifera MAFF 305830]
MNTNNYNAGVPPTQPSVSTRIESHIPGTQAHRERNYLDHENQAAHVGAGPGAATGFHQGTAMNQAPGYTNNTMTGTGGGIGAPTHGMAPAAAPAPVGNHGTTMGERVAELQGRRGHAAAATNTTAPLTSTAPTTGAKPHLGDRVMGGVEAAIGRATHNPGMEQSGWERKTFGDPKHRAGTAGGIGHGAGQPTTLNQHQGFGPSGQPAQQGFTNPQPGYTNPQPGYAAGTQPPTGY